MANFAFKLFNRARFDDAPPVAPVGADDALVADFNGCGVGAGLFAAEKANVGDFAEAFAAPLPSGFALPKLNDSAMGASAAGADATAASAFAPTLKEKAANGFGALLALLDAAAPTELGPPSVKPSEKPPDDNFTAVGDHAGACGFSSFGRPPNGFAGAADDASAPASAANGLTAPVTFDGARRFFRALMMRRPLSTSSDAFKIPPCGVGVSPSDPSSSPFMSWRPAPRFDISKRNDLDCRLSTVNTTVDSPRESTVEVFFDVKGVGGRKRRGELASLIASEG